MASKCSASSLPACRGDDDDDGVGQDDPGDDDDDGGGKDVADVDVHSTPPQRLSPADWWHRSREHAESEPRLAVVLPESGTVGTRGRYRRALHRLGSLHRESPTVEMRFRRQAEDLAEVVETCGCGSHRSGAAG